MFDYTTPCTVAHPHARQAFAYICAVCSKRIDPVHSMLKRFDLVCCDGESGECKACLIENADGDWLDAGAVQVLLDWYEKRCAWYQSQVDAYKAEIAAAHADIRNIEQAANTHALHRLYPPISSDESIAQVQKAMRASRDIAETAPPIEAQKAEPDKSCEWAVVNCHVLARRELNRLSSDSRPPYDAIATERWEHVRRICELAGATSVGVLRAAVPTEITGG